MCQILSVNYVSSSVSASQLRGEMEGASVESHIRGEVLSEVCFVYFSVCVWYTHCGMTEPPSAGSLVHHRGVGVHESCQ